MQEFDSFENDNDQKSSEYIEIADDFLDSQLNVNESKSHAHRQFDGSFRNHSYDDNNFNNSPQEQDENAAAGQQIGIDDSDTPNETKQTYGIMKKLPCIKTCIEQVSIGGPFHEVAIDKDFAALDTSQVSSLECRATCHKTKVCPELLPINCAVYLSQECSCQTVCERRVRFNSQFVKEPETTLQIEDVLRNNS